MRMLKLKILNFIRILPWSCKNFHLVISLPMYLLTDINMCPKRLKRLQREEAPQMSGPPYPTKITLCSYCHAPQHGRLPQWQDWWLQFGSGKKTTCIDSILCTSIQLFIFQMVVPWQFFINKKLQWGDSCCDEPCSASVVLPQLMTEGSRREPNLRLSSIIK